MKKFAAAAVLSLVFAVPAFATKHYVKHPKPVHTQQPHFAKHPKAIHPQNPHLKHPVKHQVDHPPKHHHHLWPFHKKR